jgi:hypothetical protein
MKRLSIIPSVLTVVLVTCSAPAHAQFYVGGGYGHTFARRAAPGFTRNIAFFIESERPEEPLGVRFEGNETISIFFFTGNVTYAFGSRDARHTIRTLWRRRIDAQCWRGSSVQIPQFKTGPVCGSARVSSGQGQRVSAYHSAGHPRGSGRILMLRSSLVYRLRYG